MGADYYLSFTTGLLGGFGHCIGMCGPIVASFAWKHQVPGGEPAPGQWTRQLQYHAGRIATYSLVGAVMGLSGSFVNVAGKMAGAQNLVAFGAGIMMVLMGLSISGLWSGASLLERHTGVVLSAARRAISVPSGLRYPALGLILGLLPCGLSYTVFIAATGSGGALQGALISLLFGLGTMPAVMLFGTLTASFSASLRGLIYRSGGVAIVVMGILFILRGVRGHAGM
jgi:sulfite exporter TauE/SafE